MARVVAVYNEGHNRPDLTQAPVRFSCELSASAERISKDTGCEFNVTHSKNVYGPYRRFLEGRYVATFQFASVSTCEGSATVEVVARGRTLQKAEIDLSKDRRVVIPFAVSVVDQAMNPFEFRTTGNMGCHLLSGIEVAPN